MPFIPALWRIASFWLALFSNNKMSMKKRKREREEREGRKEVSSKFESIILQLCWSNRLSLSQETQASRGCEGKQKF
jgi:hypothetical protein